MTFLRFQYREITDPLLAPDPDWIEGPRVDEATAGTVEIPGTDVVGGTFQVRYRRETDAGLTSEWVVQEPATITAPLVTAPRPPDEIRFERCGLVWRSAPDLGNLAGYLLREAAEDHRYWADARPLHDGLWTSPFFPSCLIPRGRRTILIRGVDTDGNQGAEGTIVVNRGDFDESGDEVLETQTEGPGWSGTKTGCTDVGDALLADASGEAYPPKQDGLDSLADMSDDPTATAWPTMYSDLRYQFSFTPASTSALTLSGPQATFLSLAVTVGVGRDWYVEYRIEDGPAFPVSDYSTPDFPHANTNSRAWPLVDDSGPAFGDDADSDDPADELDEAWEEVHWKRWTGALYLGERQQVSFRVTIPGGVQRGRLDQVVLTLSRVPEPATAAALAVEVLARAAADLATQAAAEATAAAALSAHVAAPDPHTGYQLETEKNQASGYAGLNAAQRIVKGAIATDDFIVDDATKGFILKDTAAPAHYWRISVSTLGVLSTTDLGIAPP